MTTAPKEFYDKEFAGVRYAHYGRPEAHPFFAELSRRVDQFGLADQRCLEIGCGRGYLQDVVHDCTGFDLSESVRACLHKPFVQGDATHLPFLDGSFDAIWTYAALEHVPQPELALAEMRRVLRDGGILLLAPAWQCRPWAAAGLAVRSYHDLSFRLKIEKALLPVRDSVLYRALFILPRRALGWLMHRVARHAARHPTAFRYRVLRPNYQEPLCADSDAVNHMDPYEAILWFTSRGDECLSHTTALRRFFVRTGCVVFRIRKQTAHE